MSYTALPWNAAAMTNAPSFKCKSAHVSIGFFTYIVAAFNVQTIDIKDDDLSVVRRISTVAWTIFDK